VGKNPKKEERKKGGHRSRHVSRKRGNIKRTLKSLKLTQKNRPYAAHSLPGRGVHRRRGVTPVLARAKFGQEARVACDSWGKKKQSMRKERRKGVGEEEESEKKNRKGGRDTTQSTGA